MRPPGSKELLLEQKVPATYLALEDVINYIATERKANGFDPVLNAEQYRNLVTTEMLQRYNKTFRDWSELHQATLFLHENGEFLISNILFFNSCSYTILTFYRRITTLRRRYSKRSLFPGSPVVVRHVSARRNHKRNKSFCQDRRDEIRRFETHF